MKKLTLVAFAILALFAIPAEAKREWPETLKFKGRAYIKIVPTGEWHDIGGQNRYRDREYLHDGWDGEYIVKPTAAGIIRSTKNVKLVVRITPHQNRNPGFRGGTTDIDWTASRNRYITNGAHKDFEVGSTHVDVRTSWGQPKSYKLKCDVVIYVKELTDRDGNVQTFKIPSP